MRVVVWLALGLWACSDDNKQGAIDARSDGDGLVLDTHDTADATGDGEAAAPDGEDGAPSDTTADTADTTPADTTPADTTPADTTPADTTPDTTPTDTTADLDAAEAADFDGPRGQCAQTSDCPAGLICIATAPGGLCNGCGTDDQCPEGATCNVGGCSQTCGGDADCPPGLHCHSTQHVCALKSCATNAAACDAPYECDGLFCRRPNCDEHTGACPAPLICVDEYCVEPYWSP
jgi:hypothetical protein